MTEIDGIKLNRNEIAAWRCEQCRRLIDVQHAPTMMIVAEPTLGAYFESGELIQALYGKRRVVVCSRCRIEISNTRFGG